MSGHSGTTKRSRTAGSGSNKKTEPVEAIMPDLKDPKVAAVAKKLRKLSIKEDDVEVPEAVMPDREDPNVEVVAKKMEKLSINGDNTIEAIMPDLEDPKVSKVAKKLGKLSLEETSGKTTSSRVAKGPAGSKVIKPNRGPSSSDKTKPPKSKSSKTTNASRTTNVRNGEDKKKNGKGERV